MPVHFYFYFRGLGLLGDKVGDHAGWFYAGRGFVAAFEFECEFVMMQVGHAHRVLVSSKPLTESIASRTASASRRRRGKAARLSDKGEGRWGETELVPDAVLDECFKPSTAQPSYGMTWWLFGQWR